ncbi:MAG: DUF2029 domain-containing protein, partial [Chloroflexi bacterium]|nr:DUF2029 domain-containing protein [Chloroflexota bacterium]
MRVALLLITGLGIVVFIKMPFLTAWDFRNNLWGPAYLLLHGRSPYDIAALFQCCNAVWFPMIIGLLFPLGWLAQSEATNLWLIANLAMLIAVVWLSLRARRPPLRFLTTALILAFIFPSTVSHLVLGQLTLAVVLLALIVARLTLPPRPEPDPRLDRGLSKGVEGPRPMLAGAMAALALAKPQLAILFIPGLMLTFARIGGRRAVALFLTAITATTALLVLPLYAGYPAWPDDFLATVRATPEWAHPSLLTLLDSHLGTLGLIVWGIIFAAGFGLNLW